MLIARRKNIYFKVGQSILPSISNAFVNIQSNGSKNSIPRHGREAKARTGTHQSPGTAHRPDGMKLNMRKLRA